MGITRRSLVGALTLTVFLGLSGCANDSASTQGGAKPGPGSVGVRDVSKWHPSFTPSTSPVSEVEAGQSRLDQANHVLQVYGLPEYMTANDLPSLIRWVSVEDSSEVIAECLTKGGFPSSAANGTVETKDLAEEQKETYAHFYADCTAQYPIDPRYTREWDEDQWKIQYEYLTDYYIPCIESFGVKIDEKSIPTEQVFVEDALYRKDMWHPVSEWAGEATDYPELSDTRTEQGAALAKACPQMAPSQHLFGD